MNISKVSVDRQYLISLPNYENIRIGASVEAILGDDEILEDAYKILTEKLDDLLMEDVAALSDE